ncbi:isochorismatase family protein [bacterium]|nr:isochorismatase family protein [bacterium]
MNLRHIACAFVIAVHAFVIGSDVISADVAKPELNLRVRRQFETSPGSGRFHTVTEPKTWSGGETAIIVCDVWDAHHCLNAVRRMEQFLPRLNEVLTSARASGMTVIHAPSECMASYENHPARKRAIETPKAAQLPPDIGKWCSRIPSEEAAAYPIDQSDGGEDDDPAEHAEWAARLAAMGRNPKAPWKAQHPAVKIDAENDYISDKGDEIWSILERKGIKNVVLVGVHTNMCVLGRPFGLRQMAKNGKNAVLLRDLTDTMYNPERRPYVSHLTGTDRIIDHIERHVAASVTSDQFTGGKPFRFKEDTRPRVALIMAEDEYETERTLTEFALTNLGHDFSIRPIYGSETDKYDIPGLEALEESDVLVISARRRPIKQDQLARIQAFVRSGKPVVGIRTASHAFHLRTGQLPEGVAGWPEIDAEVWGGKYTNHHANDLKSQVKLIEAAREHPILTGVQSPFAQGGSLYQVSPIDSKAVPLLSGVAEGFAPEPVAWTFTRADGGRSFYTSLGHKNDFANPAFQRLLVNALFWAAGKSVPADFQIPRSPLMKPGDWNTTTWAAPERPWFDLDGDQAGGTEVWVRCLVAIPEDAAAIELRTAFCEDVFVNGKAASKEAASAKEMCWSIDPSLVEPGELNLIVLRWARGSDPKGAAPSLMVSGRPAPLGPVWEVRQTHSGEAASLPLPAKFAAATTLISR